MTDARLAPTFLANVKIDGLSDPAFRAYVNSIVLGASQETDGHIARRSLRYLHPEADLVACANELVNARLWEPRPDGDGWSIHDFLKYQTPRAQLERARENDRVRKARERERKAARAKPSDRDSADSPTVTPGDVTPDTAGQDRPETGQAEKGEQEQPHATWAKPIGSYCVECNGYLGQDAQRDRCAECAPESTDSKEGTAA